MKKKVNITICIPCYPKHTKFLLRCLQSVEKQTIHPKKVIIGHSEIDNIESLKLQKKLSIFTFPVRIISTKKKSNVGYNRNRCVPYCKTKYISFFDADDIMVSERIEILWDNITKFSPKCLIHSYTESLDGFEKGGGKKKYKIVKTKEIYCFINSKFPEQKYKFTRGHITVEKEIFNKVQYSNEKRGQDTIFLNKIINKYNKRSNDIIYIDSPLTIYTTKYYKRFYRNLLAGNIKHYNVTIFKYIIYPLVDIKNTLLKEK